MDRFNAPFPTEQRFFLPFVKGEERSGRQGPSWAPYPKAWARGARFGIEHGACEGISDILHAGDFWAVGCGRDVRTRWNASLPRWVADRCSTTGKPASATSGCNGTPLGEAPGLQDCGLAVNWAELDAVLGRWHFGEQTFYYSCGRFLPGTFRKPRPRFRVKCGCGFPEARGTDTFAFLPRAEAAGLLSNVPSGTGRRVC
jgi:hypothetical protein